MPRGRGDDMHVIELTIPMTQNMTEFSPGGECHICASAFCKNFTDPCCRGSTHLKCCTQRLCTMCLVKMAKKCTCKLSCNEVIAFCPFCREISGISKEELFRGSRQVCQKCQEQTTSGDIPAQVQSTDAAVDSDVDRSPEVSSRLQAWFTSAV